ncbi:putative amidase family protein, partial [Aureobasidium melanogenum]
MSDKTALVVVDVQDGIANALDGVPDAEQIKQAIGSVLDLARQYNQEYDPLHRGKATWNLVFPPQQDVATERLSSKNIGDMFTSHPDLASSLCTEGVTNLVFVGLQTDFCVRASIIGALASGFNAFNIKLLQGAHSTYDDATTGRSYREIKEDVETQLSNLGIPHSMPIELGRDNRIIPPTAGGRRTWLKQKGFGEIQMQLLSCLRLPNRYTGGSHVARTLAASTRLETAQYFASCTHSAVYNSRRPGHCYRTMGTMMDVRELTLGRAHEAFKTGAYTAVDLTAIYLERIRLFDKTGPKINSTLAISQGALEEAKRLDEHFAQTGSFRGRLHGIPILVKDQADTAGMETMYGSGACKGNIPTEDAFLVKQLKAEGAVILGKTTMSEWASTWFSHSSASDWEPTKNPYKLDHDVGGSSCGSAAAVAANFALLAVAEDTGGSVRCPASFTNLVGLRPTPGLVSRSGFCPLVKVQDTPGPVARTVQDCALFFDCMVGFDPQDNYTGVAALAKSLGLPIGGSYASNLDQGFSNIRQAKIGVVRQLFGPDSDLHCLAVNQVINKAFSALKEQGTTFMDVHLDKLEHYMTFTPTYLQRSRTDINSFLATKPHLPQDVADIVPAEASEEFLSFTSQITHGPLDPLQDPEYLPKILDRDEFKRELDSLMASLNLDALAFPDVQIPPPKHEDATNGRFPSCWDFPVNTLLASQARLPAITVPVGFTGDGLPVGLELVSYEYHEQALFQFARGIEIVVGARRAPDI